MVLAEGKKPNCFEVACSLGISRSRIQPFCLFAAWGLSDLGKVIQVDIPSGFRIIKGLLNFG